MRLEGSRYVKRYSRDTSRALEIQVHNGRDRHPPPNQLLLVKTRAHFGQALCRTPELSETHANKKKVQPDVGFEASKAITHRTDHEIQTI